MKVLITGGCGFIGSHVADRFYKEGHLIYIIDNLSTGNEKNVQVPHKFYKMDIASEECTEVFRANRFDVVVNLSAQADVRTSIEIPYIDSKSNLLGLTNMLDLSKKFGVKKFIFASSAAVYGNTDKIPIKEETEKNPISPYAMSKTVGEFYCEKWYEIFGLKTLCFRFSNVYGPRQGLKGESGVVSIFMEKCFENEQLVVFGDGNQTRDFIYVEDIADGIYKAVERDVTGVFNLSTNTETTVNELIDIIKGYTEVKSIEYKDARPGDIKKSRLDNTKVQQTLNWHPKYSFEEGMKKTVAWYEKYEKEKLEDAKKEPKIKTKRKSLRLESKSFPYIENIIWFIVIFAITKILQNKYFSITGSLDLSYVYIVLMAVIYGMRQAIFSITVSILLYLYFMVSSGTDIMAILYEPKYIIHIAYYVIIGSIVGYRTDRTQRKVYEDELEIQSINEKYDFLEIIYNETRLVKEKLQEQIVSSEDSFASIYNTTKALDSLNYEEIYIAAVKCLENLLKTERASIYALNKDQTYLRLKEKSTKDDFSLPFSIKVTDSNIINDVIVNKKMYINKTMESGIPVMMAPIVDAETNKAVALVSVHKFEFERLNLYSQNLFNVLVNLISSAVTNAHKYEQMANKEKFIPGTEILIPKEFEVRLKEKIEIRQDQGMDFVLLKTVKKEENYQETFHQIAISVRDLDIIGLGNDDYIYIILSNTDYLKAIRVIERLASRNIKSQVVKVERQDE